MLFSDSKTNTLRDALKFPHYVHIFGPAHFWRNEKKANVNQRLSMQIKALRDMILDKEKRTVNMGYLAGFLKIFIYFFAENDVIF